MKFTEKSILLIAGASAFANAERSEVGVGFEYQLEVNNVNKEGTTEEVLANIDSEILNALQEALPNGFTVNENNELKVQFDQINSQIYSACFTDSEACSLVRSWLTISYEGDKPRNSLKFVALQLVQDYLENYTENNPRLTTTYQFPSVVRTLSQFSMEVVYGKMTWKEIKVLEETFMEVFGAIVFAMEGDTEIVDSQFVYQDLLEYGGRRHLEQNYTLTTDMKVRGLCRDCNSDEFADVVNGSIEANLQAFKSKLKRNANNRDSTFFDDVDVILYAVPELPSPLPDIEDESIYDSKAPEVDTKAPWFLWFGISLALLIIIIGIFLLTRTKSDDVEKNNDTGDSDSDSDEEGDFVSEESSEAISEEEASEMEEVPTRDDDVVYVF